MMPIGKGARCEGSDTGGRPGTRLTEETVARPKPMVEVGGRPLLWHICRLYAAHGITEFVICCGYRGYVIKEFFANYFLHMSNVTFDLRENRMEVHQTMAEPWRITLVDTGLDTADRRPPQAYRRLRCRRGLLLHVRRWRGRCGHHGAWSNSTDPKDVLPRSLPSSRPVDSAPS